MSALQGICYGCLRQIKDVELQCPHGGYVKGLSNTADYLAPGTEIGGQYLVGTLLHKNGEGGYYIAYDRKNSRRVVLKEYFPKLLAAREPGGAVRILVGCMTQYKALMQDFLDLARTLQRQGDAPYLERVYDVFEAGGTAYAALQHFEGTVFKDFLSRSGGELSWEQTKLLFLPFIASLSEMHAAGVLHRGISPSNIMINRSGEMKLTHFGISSVRTAHSELTAELYPGYTAPEQYKENGWQGTWSDVYAVGAVMYRTLTGARPTDSVDRIADDTLMPCHAHNRSIPKSISAAISGAMTVSPEKRMHTFKELLTALTASRDGDVIEEEKQVRREVVVKQHKKQRRTTLRVTLISLFATLVILAALVFALQGMLGGGGNASSSPSSAASIASGEVIVPDFTGKTLQQINNNPVYDDFLLQVEEAYSLQVPLGIIISQDPAPYLPGTRGMTVIVRVSRGPEKVDMPQVVGLSEGDAVAALDALGIKYNRYYIVDDTVANGIVARTDKPQGTKIDITAERVNLFIAQY